MLIIILPLARLLGLSIVSPWALSRCGPQLDNAKSRTNIIIFISHNPHVAHAVAAIFPSICSYPHSPFYYHALWRKVMVVWVLVSNVACLFNLCSVYSYTFNQVDFLLLSNYPQSRFFSSMSWILKKLFHGSQLHIFLKFCKAQTPIVIKAGLIFEPSLQPRQILLLLLLTRKQDISFSWIHNNKIVSPR